MPHMELSGDFKSGINKRTTIHNSFISTMSCKNAIVFVAKVY